VTTENKPTVAGLVVAPNGAQMWVAHDKPIHISVHAGEPFARVYVNGVCITQPPGNLDFDGHMSDASFFDRPLSDEEVKRFHEASSA
jgi:hypothetical protein